VVIADNPEEALNKMVAGAAGNKQKLVQSEQAHQAKMKQVKETKSLQSKNGPSGKNTQSRKPSSKG
jgi:hypothetical protein